MSVPRATKFSHLCMLALLSACSRPLGNRACTAALGSGDGYRQGKAALIKKFGLPPTAAGGILETNFLVDFDSGKTESRFCTVTVTAPANGAKDKLRIWTADHCVWPAFTVSMKLHLFLRDGYVPLEVSSSALARGKSAREKADSLSFSSKNMLFRAINGKGSRPERMAAAATGRCKRFDPESLEQKTQGPVEVCFAQNDLLSLLVELPGSLTEIQREAVDSSMKSDGQFRRAAQKISHGASFRDQSERLSDLAFEARSNQASLDVVQMLLKCPSVAAPTSPPYCTERRAIEEILLSVPSVAQSAGRSSASTNSTLADLEKQLVADTAASWSKADKISDTLWKDSGTLIRDSTVHFNLFSLEAGFQPRFFTWLPIFNDPAQIFNSPGYDSKAIIGRNNPKLGLQMHPGDSGSIVMIGDTPIAALSTKDGAGTSGGASVINLPTRRKPKEALSSASKVNGTVGSPPARSSDVPAPESRASSTQDSPLPSSDDRRPASSPSKDVGAPESRPAMSSGIPAPEFNSSTSTRNEATYSSDERRSTSESESTTSSSSPDGGQPNHIGDGASRPQQDASTKSQSKDGEPQEQAKSGGGSEAVETASMASEYDCGAR